MTTPNNESPRVALLGATGRTGNFVVSSLTHPGLGKLVAACVSAQSSQLGKTVAGHELRFEVLSSEALGRAQVVIDFSLPLATQDLIKTSRALPRAPALVIASTGHTTAQMDAIRDAAKQMPILVCGNTSLGIFALKRAAQAVQRILGAEFDIEILDVHHRHKRDAPSGATKMLAEALHLPVKYGREGLRSHGEIGLAALRGGDVAGDHSVYFFGEGERLELTHRAEGRITFARGALLLAQQLLGRGPGLYSIDDFHGG